MNKFIATGLICAFLTACDSTVKLDEVPVEDKSASQVSANGSASADQNANANAGGTGVESTAGNVNPTSVDQTNQDVTNLIAGKIVYFGFDSYVIEPEYQKVIESQAALLRANRSKRVTLEGHTDERGGREYNLALGQSRAEAVRKALSLLGVQDSQLEAVSFGKEKPADARGTEEAMAKNRRVEFSVR